MLFNFNWHNLPHELPLIIMGIIIYDFDANFDI